MELIDDVGRRVFLDNTPARVVSLVPSITKTICDLGLFSHLAGITEYCIHPAEVVQHIPKIGRTKTIDIEKIKQIKPDLVIATKEENPQAAIEKISLDFPCYVFDINSIEDALRMIEALGGIFETREKAGKMNEEILKSFEKGVGNKVSSTFLYFVWKKPYMAAAPGTFINDVLSHFGLTNIIDDRACKYPKINLEDIEHDPDIVFLPTEPCHFTREDGIKISAILKSSKIMWINGEVCSWYGSRMKEAGSFLRKTI